MISRRQFDETLQRLSSFPGVKGVIITNNEGLSIATTFPAEETERNAAMVTALVGKAKYTINEMNHGKINWLQIDTEGGEIFVAPEDEYIIVVFREKQYHPM